MKTWRDVTWGQSGNLKIKISEKEAVFCDGKDQNVVMGAENWNTSNEN